MVGAGLADALGGDGDAGVLGEGLVDELGELRILEGGPPAGEIGLGLGLARIGGVFPGGGEGEGGSGAGKRLAGGEQGEAGEEEGLRSVGAEHEFDGT